MQSSGSNSALAKQPLGMEWEAEHASSMAANKKHVYLHEWKLCISARLLIFEAAAFILGFCAYAYTGIIGTPAALLVEGEQT